jgi:DNA polymerase III epsilon subunit-like protein
MHDFPSPWETKPLIEAFLQKHIDRYDKADKFYAAGQNVGFDLEFLARFFRRAGDPYFGSYFNWRKIDLLAMVDLLSWQGKLSLKDRKLATICEHLGVQLGAAHDALADVRATRECILKLRELFT